MRSRLQLAVINTDPAAKGDTRTNALKPATLALAGNWLTHATR